MVKVNLVLDCRCKHGEGPVWNPRSKNLLWTDIEGFSLLIFDQANHSFRVLPLQHKLGSFAVIDEHTILAAFEKSLAILDIRTGKIRKETPIETDVETTRMNDGRTDRSGRFVVSGFDPEEKGRSGVYQIREDLSIVPWFRGISSGNSICFSPDGQRMYFADSPEGIIWAYDYDSDRGTLGDKTIFFDFKDEPGIPDGSVVDSEGCLWNAEWGGSRIIRVSPKGKLIQVIEMPVKNPTCLAFGGNDLQTLFITTSQLALTSTELAKTPCAGSLYSVSIEVPGLADLPFFYR